MAYFGILVYSRSGLLGSGILLHPNSCIHAVVSSRGIAYMDIGTQDSPKAPTVGAWSKNPESVPIIQHTARVLLHERYTTAMDGRSVNNAGALIDHYNLIYIAASDSCPPAAYSSSMNIKKPVQLYVIRVLYRGGLNIFEIKPPLFC